MFKSMPKKITAFLIMCLLLPGGGMAGAETATMPISGLPQNAKLALCGDSITEQMRYTKYVEIYLRACAGRNDISVFQFGWAGENADQFSNRIKRGDLDAFRPTAVTFLYGANDAGPMKWEPWMEAMWKGRVTNILTNLNSKYPETAANTVICSPTVFDLNPAGTNAGNFAVSNDTLSRLRDLDINMAKTNAKGFADIRQRMLTVNAAAKAALGKDFRIGGRDGIHPGPNGHLIIAYEILKSLNCDGVIATITVDMAKGQTTVSAGHNLVSSDGGKITIDSTRYPFCCNYDGSADADRMATILPFLPFSQDLNRFVLIVKNPGAAKADITWGNVTKTFTGTELGAGVNLAEKFPNTPFDSKFAAVIGLIEKKQIKERDMIKAAKDATAPAKGWTDADVATRNALDAEVKAAITPVRHTITIKFE